MNMQTLTHLGAFTGQTRDAINTNFALLAAFGALGNVFILDPYRGADGDPAAGWGTTPSQSFKTLAAAYAALTDGSGDVVRLRSNGATTSTARSDTAIAWAKSACRLIGDCAPVPYSQRSRIAPTSATVGATANRNYVTVSGSDNIFANVGIWAGFATGIAATIALTVSGSRNLFKGMHIVGHADAVSAADTDSYSLKLTGSENLFEDCVIGCNTVMRTAANASILFAGGAARNTFRRCIFPVWTSATTSLIWSVPAANPNGSDRETIFEDCKFLNMINVTGAATMAAAGTVIAGGINGYFLLKDCVRVGITDWGTDAASNARIWLSGSGDEAQAGDEVGRALVAAAS